MAPSRKQNNGRSPLVNPQRQITAFFSKTPSPSPTQKPAKTVTNTVPKPSPRSPSPIEKPLLVIDQTPSPSQSASTPGAAVKPYGAEVVEKRIRIYWPLDKCWYEGCVKSYDKKSGKHLVLYDDCEEENLDLGKEKIEWVEDTTVRFKRLRRGSLAFKRTVIDNDDDDDDEMKDVVDADHDNDGGNDSSDEDWGKSSEKEVTEEEGDMDLEEEVEEVSDEDDNKKGKRNDKRGLRKRKASGGKVDSVKKSKACGDMDKVGLRISAAEPLENKQNGVSNSLDDHLMADPSERFSAREAQRLWFLGRERKDAKRRHPGDADYDARTLYLPADFLKGLTGGQRQWWEFKSKHMDKVLFFKMGKFYELFEMDAHVGVKELDLQYMKGEQPHCGFPERNFSINVEKLARKGYRVLVVEQTETPEQLELRRKEQGSKDKGELLSANPDASYLMAVAESSEHLTDKSFQRLFGCVWLILPPAGLSLDRFFIFCSIIRVEASGNHKAAKMLSSETERAIMRHTRNPLVNELVPLSEFWDANTTVREVEIIYKRIRDQSASGNLIEGDLESVNLHTEDKKSRWLPVILSELVKKGENGSLALSALGGTLYYLKQAFLDETLLRFAKFESLPCSEFAGIDKKPYMVLDAAAMENLEIFENNRNGDSSGTLYAQLNHCVTAMGKRLLKTWLARPLYHLDSIKVRQDAVKDLQGKNQTMALEFRKALSRLPDMERLLARIFTSSEANGRNAKKVILYEDDAAKKQLQEFISALRGCELMAQACSSLGVILEHVEARQLHYLLTSGNGVPDIHSILQQFKDAFNWAEANSSGRVIPLGGVDAQYDSACRRLMEIESDLAKHLKEQQKLLGDTSITYVTVGKEAYLLEVPEHLRASIPRDYELRSSKKGFFRYWNPNIKRLLAELSQTESEKESTLKNISQQLIGRFCLHHDKWRQLVSAVAELDVLISLSIAGDFYEGPSCCPIILHPSSLSSEVPRLSAKCLGHPVLKSDSLNKGAFVPNDINIGGSGCASFILLTGPNMGGKSTLIRQVCLAVMLAQVGASVPAQNFELSPVDRIFVRMGAKDHIMACQSTFLTELSETALMLSSATGNSLVALDELVLEHLVHKVQCRGMFSTHYHRLAVDYEKDTKVSLCHMACQVGNEVGGIEEVTFLYRLTPGVCPKSYGVNVARLAGIPVSVLKEATSKSRELETICANHKKGSDWKLAIPSCNEMVVLIHNLMNLTTKLDCSGSYENPGISSLTQLQHRVRKLLQI
ncbi:hypothetical protein K2173_010220 [Erythroxylum novogranatense]|uniref:DNA mismatch repair protein n=1 Tax=Erythroxylum novogranatense TaxID=1862640 RepID=A0AAV8UCL9_9ROSI|nr:hypothetical protein K2173_010220 [Erythroxylum novogranatense]